MDLVISPKMLGTISAVLITPLVTIWAIGVLLPALTLEYSLLTYLAMLWIEMRVFKFRYEST